MFFQLSTFALIERQEEVIPLSVNNWLVGGVLKGGFVFLQMMKEGSVSVSVRGGGVSYGGGVCELYYQ